MRALFALAVALLAVALGGLIVAGPAPGIAQDATPGATPCPSPVASPVASPATSPAGTPTGAAGCLVEVTETEFAIEMPDTLPAGPVTFRVTNAGTIEHNFEVEGQGIEEELPANLQPGESGTLEVDLEPGTYEVYCPVGNHEAQGMRVELTVTEG